MKKYIRSSETNYNQSELREYLEYTYMNYLPGSEFVSIRSLDHQSDATIVFNTDETLQGCKIPLKDIQLFFYITYNDGVIDGVYLEAHLDERYNYDDFRNLIFDHRHTYHSLQEIPVLSKSQFVEKLQKWLHEVEVDLRRRNKKSSAPSKSTINRGIKSYFNYIANYVEERLGYRPKFKLVNYTLDTADSDEDEYVYNVLFTDQDGQENESPVAFLKVDEGDWVWDHDVVDRTDWLNEEAETYVNSKM